MQDKNVVPLKLWNYNYMKLTWLITFTKYIKLANSKQRLFIGRTIYSWTMRPKQLHLYYLYLNLIIYAQVNSCNSKYTSHIWATSETVMPDINSTFKNQENDDIIVVLRP